MPRLVEERVGRALLDDLAGVHDGRPLAHLSDDGQVVGDQDHRQARARRSATRAARGSAPAPSRRARWSARRRAAPSGCTRAPSRSRRAVACRPRTRAGSGRCAVRRRSRPARAARPPACAPPCRWRCRAARIGSAICSPIRLTGLKAFIAPWNTIAMSFQRCGETVSSPPAMMSVALQHHLAGDGGARRQQAHHGQDAGRLAAARLADQPQPLARDRSRSIPCTACSSPPLREVEPDVQVADLEHRRRGVARAQSASRPSDQRPQAERGAPTGDRPSAAG